MPILKRKSRSDHVKLYRPNGTRYSEAHGEVYFSATKYPIAKSICIEMTVRNAVMKFHEEFGELPEGSFVIEAVVMGRTIVANVFDIPEVE